MWLFLTVVNWFSYQVNRIDLFSSTLQRKEYDAQIFYLENRKEKKRKISTGGESENGQGSESDSSSSDDHKKKKKSKHKKKEKHRRKKEAKRLAKLAAEADNQPEEPVNNEANEKTNELSGRDIMGLKTTIDPDEIPEIPAHKFLFRPTANDNNETR